MDMHRGDLTPERILHYIDANFDRPLTPRDVAAALHYSTCHLSHVARRELGCTVRDLIFERRMAAARRLLAETHLPVSRIAARVGFADVAHFSRRFSHETGCAPTHWRKINAAAQHARPRCQACGRAFPLIAAAQDDTAEAADAAS